MNRGCRAGGPVRMRMGQPGQPSIRASLVNRMDKESDQSRNPQQLRSPSHATDRGGYHHGRAAGRHDSIRRAGPSLPRAGGRHHAAQTAGSRVHRAQSPLGAEVSRPGATARWALAVLPVGRCRQGRRRVGASAMRVRGALADGVATLQSEAPDPLLRWWPKTASPPPSAAAGGFIFLLGRGSARETCSGRDPFGVPVRESKSRWAPLPRPATGAGPCQYAARHDEAATGGRWRQGGGASHPVVEDVPMRGGWRAEEESEADAWRSSPGVRWFMRRGRLSVFTGDFGRFALSAESKC